MSGFLRGFPRSCPAYFWRGDVLKYASPYTAGQAVENPCLSRHSPFLRATADAAPAKMSGIPHLIYKLKVLSFSSKKYLIYELDTQRVHFGQGQSN